MDAAAITENRDLAYRYLVRLLPDTSSGEIAAALEESDKEQLVPLIAEVGRHVGAHFYRVDACVSDLMAQQSGLRALELSDEPRVLILSPDGQVEIHYGPATTLVTPESLGTGERGFIVPSPRMTLAALRGRQGVRRVLSYLATEKPLLQALVVYAIFVEALSLAAPLAVQVLINTIGFGMMTQQLVVISTLLFIGLSGAAALKVAQQVLVEHLSRRFFARSVMDYSERLTLVELRGMSNPVHRFFEVASVDKAFFALGLDLIALVLQLVATTILLAFYHPALLAFTFIMATTSWLIVRVPFSSALRRSISESEAKYALADFIQSKKNDEVSRMARFNRWEEARSSGFRIALGQQIGLHAVQVVLAVALLFVGGALVIEGSLTLGQLVAAELIAGTALLSLNKLGKQLPKIYDLITSFEKLGGFVDLPIRPGPTGLTRAPSLPASLRSPRREGDLS